VKIEALVIIRNLESSAECLNFGDFTISLVGPRFAVLRQFFSSGDINDDDWIFEKSYGSIEEIPTDIEDILLLFRLYSVGDIAFIKLASKIQSVPAVTRPNRVINDLNSLCHPALKFKFESEKCESWKVFAEGIRRCGSWSSEWFAAARRFFLAGGAKPFRPEQDDVDRLVDYATALESALVPERSYNGRRGGRRAAALIAPNDPAQKEAIVRFIKRFYEIRSRIVHGSRLGDENRQWLSENCRELELRLRQILVTAVQSIPPGENDRRVALAGLYDPTDEDRGSSAIEKFREIKTPEVRKAIAAKIAELAGE